MCFSVLGLLHFTWYPSVHAWWQDFSFVTAVPLCIPLTFSLCIPSSMDNSCIPYLTYFLTITMEVKTPQETNLYSLGSMSNGNVTLPYSAWCCIEPQHPKLGQSKNSHLHFRSSLEVPSLRCFVIGTENGLLLTLTLDGLSSTTTFYTRERVTLK